MTEILNQFSYLLSDSLWLAPLIAFLGGLFTAFTPCCLASVPLIMGYIGGSAELSKRSSFVYASIFSLGFIISSTLLGIIVAFLGIMAVSFIYSSWWYIILGFVLLVMALQIWGIVNVVPSLGFINKTKRRGKFGAVIVGFLGGIFSSPCSTPVLVALLAIVAQRGSLLWGIFLLLMYSLGHSLLFLFAGTFTGVFKKVMKTEGYGKVSTYLNWLVGFIILLFGFYLIYLGI